jgi:hypothetical protein
LSQESYERLLGAAAARFIALDKVSAIGTPQPGRPIALEPESSNGRRTTRKT